MELLHSQYDILDSGLFYDTFVCACSRCLIPLGVLYVQGCLICNSMLDLGYDYKSRFNNDFCERKRMGSVPCVGTQNHRYTTGPARPPGKQKQLKDERPWNKRECPTGEKPQTPMQHALDQSGLRSTIGRLFHCWDKFSMQCDMWRKTSALKQGRRNGYDGSDLTWF